MPDLAELHLRIKSLEVDQAKRRLREFRQEGRRAADGAKNLSGEMRKTSKAAELLSAKFRQMVIGLAAVTTSVLSFGRAIQLSAQFEQIRLGFETLLGGADNATRTLMDLEEFAATTPFQFQELAGAAKLMLALGFEGDKVVETMRTLGDATAALGGGTPLLQRLILAIGQMQAKAKVSGEEMRQLAEAGIPAWEIVAEAIGTTIPEAMKLAEKGAIDVETAITGLLEGMQQRFAGATDRLAQSLLGLFSTMKDVLDFALRDIGDVLVEAFDIKDTLRGLIAGLAAVGKALKDGRDIILLVVDAAKALAVTLAFLLAAKLASMLPTITAMVAGFKSLEIAMVGLNVVIGTTNATLAISPIFLLAAVLGGLTLAFFRWRRSMEEAASDIDELTKSTRKLFVSLSELASAATTTERISGGTAVVAAAQAQLENLQKQIDSVVESSDKLRRLQTQLGQIGGSFASLDLIRPPGVDDDLLQGEHVLRLIALDKERLRLHELLLKEQQKLFDATLTHIAELEVAAFEYKQAFEAAPEGSDEARTALENQLDALKQLREFLNRIQEDDVLSELNIPAITFRSMENLGDLLEQLTAKLKALKAEAQREDITDFIAGIEREANMLGASAEARQRSNLQLQAENIARKLKTQLTEEESAALQRAIDLLIRQQQIQAASEIDKRIDQMRQEVDLLKLSNTEREIEETLLSFHQQATEAGIVLTDAQIASIRSLIEARAAANETLRREIELRREQQRILANRGVFDEAFFGLLQERTLLELSNEEREKEVILRRLTALGMEAQIENLEELLELAAKEIDLLQQRKRELAENEDQQRRLNFLIDESANRFAQALTDVLTFSQSLSDSLEGLARSIQRLVVEQLVAIPIANAFADALKSAGEGSKEGGGIGGFFSGLLEGFFGSLFGGAHGAIIEGNRVQQAQRDTVKIPAAAHGAIIEGNRVQRVYRDTVRIPAAQHGAIIHATAPPGITQAHRDFVNVRIPAAQHGMVIREPSIIPPGVAVAEAGEPEGVLPLKRTAGGDLGVQVAGGTGRNVTVHATFVTPDLQSFRKSEAQWSRDMARAIDRATQGERRGF